MAEINQNRGQLKYPPDQETIRAVEFALDRLLPEKIFDIVWDKYFYFSTFFESIDGYGQTGTVVAGEWGFTLTSGAGTTAALTKTPEYQNVLNWHKRQRMRTNFLMTSVTSVTAQFVVGNINTDEHYGFKIVNNQVKGTVADGSTESTIDLVTITANSQHAYEARLFPGEKVVFYVDGEEKGVLTANIPWGGTSGENLQLMEAVITDDASTSKDLLASFFDYIQEK